MSLVAANGSVSGAQVDAGSGSITVAAFDSGSNASVGIFGGTYTTTGNATFNVTGTNGRISGVTAHAGTATLAAERDVNALVTVSDRVNASSATSSVTLTADGNDPLRLGTVSARNTLALQSTKGMTMAAQGQLSAARLDLFVSGSTVAAGTAGAPLLLAAPGAAAQPTVAVNVYGATAPVHLGLGASTVLDSLYLDGTVAGLGGSSLTGGANLANAGFGIDGSMLDMSLSTTSGLASGLTLNVRDGGLHARTLSLPGTSATLTAQGGVVLDAFAGGAVVIQARGDVNIGSAQTTGSGGINVSARQCSTSAFACASVNNITAGNLSASGTGGIGLYTYDNGSISVSSLTTASGDIAVTAGRTFNTSTFTSAATANGINLGTVVGGDDVYVNNIGHGNLGIGSLQAARSVDVRAGSLYVPVAFGGSVRTSNGVTVQNAGTGAQGNYSVINQGTGGVGLGGTIDRTASGSISVLAADGSVSDSAAMSARYNVSVQAGSGGVSLGDVTSNESTISISAGTSVLVGNLVAGSPSQFGGVNVSANGAVRFASIQSLGLSSAYGNVNVVAYGGPVATTVDNTGMDIVATGNVNIAAYDGTTGSIGNTAFTNPLNIQAGTTSTVTLYAAKDLGAASRPVTVDTSGTIDARSVDGQLHVAATDGVTARTVSAVRLGASAAGVGNGQSATFSSANLNVTASSDGSVLTLGDIVQTTGALNEFSFFAFGSGLNFGNVNLATTGFDTLSLSSQGPLVQTTGNILAGNLTLDAGSGNVSVGGTITANSAEVASNGRNNILRIRGTDIATGALQAQSIDVAGNGNVVVTGGVTSTGTQRGFANGAYDFTLGQYVTDELRLSAGVNLSTSGNVASATSSILSAGGTVTVGGGTGTVAGGAFGNIYYHDKVQMTGGVAAGGSVQAGALSALDVTLQAHDITVGNITANQATSVTGTALQTGTISSGTSVVLNGSSLGTGTITAPTVQLTGDTFATGNIAASSSLFINASGAYAPTGIALSSNNAQINAQGNIIVGSGSNSSLTAPNVTLRSTAGNVSVELTGTSNLTLSTGRGFAVTSNTWLNNLDVTAQWDLATDTGNGSVGATVATTTGSGTQNFSYSLGSGLNLNATSTLAAGRTWNLRYYDTSANAVVDGGNDFVVATLSHTGTGTFDFAFNSSTDFSNLNAALGSTTSGSSTPSNLRVNTGGGIHLANVQTHGGYVQASADARDILVGQISTTAEGFAGSVDLYAHGGSILLDAGGSHIIATGSSCSLCTLPTTTSYGTVTLYAPNGSVGGTGTIPLAYVSSLNVTSRDAIDLAMAAGSLNALSLGTTVGGAGVLSVTNANFGGLTLTRSAGSILLGGLNPTTLANFALFSDGGIVVTSDIANVGNLQLDAGGGDLVIAAGSGPRSVTAQTLDLSAGQDILITAGATAADGVQVRAIGSSGNSTIQAGRDVQVRAQGGSALLELTANSWTQYVYAGRDLVVAGGGNGTAGATADVRSAGYQSFSAGRDFTVQGGASTGAAASVDAAYGQFFTGVAGNLNVLGGAGDDATARMQAQGASQSLGFASAGQTIDRVLVQGGSGARATASVLSASSQDVHSDGDILVLGGTGAGADAVIASTSGSQTIGSNSTYGSAATQNILVQGGAGGIAAIRANGTQTLEAGQDITVRGGTGNAMYATVETTGTQSIGNSSFFTSSFTSYTDPTASIRVEGGSGTGAYASIRTTLASSGQQTLSASTDVVVSGGAGSGAYAEILSSGTGQQQRIGSTTTSSNDPTANIIVQGGTGAGSEARIQAQGNQTLLMGGDLRVLGGQGTNARAYVATSSGAQTIGNTSTFFNDATNGIEVRGGSGIGASAGIRSSTNQTFNVGEQMQVTGGTGTGAYAEVATGTGFQTVNNLVGGDTGVRGVVLNGGSAAGAYAMFSAGSSQQISTSGDVVVQGGSAAGADALFTATTGQNVSARGALRITGGTGDASDATVAGFDNPGSGFQNFNIGGDIVLTGGGAYSFTRILGGGNVSQSFVSTAGSMVLRAPAGTPNAEGWVQVESGTGGQSILLYNGDLVLDNAGASAVTLYSGGTQLVLAKTLSISLSSTHGANFAPHAVLGAAGDQSILLTGDRATPGTATLTVVNRSPVAGSRAAIESGGDMEILMDYNAAGLVQIGAEDALGRSLISANRRLTMVAGGLLLQGGLTADADALLLSAQADPTNGRMVLSTLYGPVELKGGALGGAYIDPPELYITSNGSVLLQAGTGAGADANINAGLFQLAATAGDLSLVTSSASPATATITAGSFFYVGPGGVYLINGTITAPDGGSITVPLECVNCDINIFGPVKVNAFVPPPVDYAALVASDVTALAQLGGGVFEALFDDEGNLVFSRRRLSQCF